MCSRHFLSWLSLLLDTDGKPYGEGFYRAAPRMSHPQTFRQVVIRLQTLFVPAIGPRSNRHHFRPGGKQLPEVSNTALSRNNSLVSWGSSRGLGGVVDGGVALVGQKRKVWR